MNKVSIIVPVYNVDKYISECVDSIINQTYKNIEIILVDDGSTDNSGKTCDNYSQNDKRIKVIHQKNAGAANAKNTGLDNVTGDYIAFIDSDDVVEADWIETMLNLAISNNADISECAFDKYYKNHYESVVDFDSSSGRFTTEEYMKQYLSRWTSSIFCNKLFRKELTENIRFRKERRCIDDEFYTYKVISNAKMIVRTNKVLYHYRQRVTGAVQSKSHQLQITDDAIELRVERYEWIKIRFPFLKKTYINNDINFLIFFSKNSMYNDSTIKKFHETAKYYFKEAIKLGIDTKLLINSIKLLKCKPKISDDAQTTTVLQSTDDCFM